MKKILVLVSLILLPLLSLNTLALEKEPFTQERFEALQTAGEVVLIDVFATWCPTCKQQQEVLARFRTDNPDADFHILVVDFDKDKEWVSHFRAPRQSTQLLYAGDKQYWYSVAETRYEVIADEINKAIAASES
jgi:thiol-disulfide isomerase/thioredoxin